MNLCCCFTPTLFSSLFCNCLYLSLSGITRAPSIAASKPDEAPIGIGGAEITDEVYQRRFSAAGLAKQSRWQAQPGLQEAVQIELLGQGPGQGQGPAQSTKSDRPSDRLVARSTIDLDTLITPGKSGELARDNWMDSPERERESDGEAKRSVGDLSPRNTARSSEGAAAAKSSGSTLVTSAFGTSVASGSATAFPLPTGSGSAVERRGSQSSTGSAMSIQQQQQSPANASISDVDLALYQLYDEMLLGPRRADQDEDDSQRLPRADSATLSASAKIASEERRAASRGPLHTMGPLVRDALTPQQREIVVAMYDLLKQGVEILKHGRSGRPKQRTLLCDAEMTRLFWRPVQPARGSGAGVFAGLLSAGKASLSKSEADRSLLIKDIKEVGSVQCAVRVYCVPYRYIW
jgi:hypothetical protein